MRPVIRIASHLLMALAVIASATHAQSSARKFTLDDFSSVKRINDPQISPDGKTIAVVVSKPNLDDDRYDPELVEVNVASRKSRTLVTAQVGLTNPRYSRDGKSLAYLASVGASGTALSVPGGNGHLQIYIMKAAGGPAKQITHAPSGVQQFSWSPDGSTIAFAAMDQPEQKTGPERFNDSFEVQINDDFLTKEDKYPTHLWIVPTAGGESKRLTSGVWSLPVSHPPGPPASAIAWTLDGLNITVARQVSAHGRGNELVNVSAKDGSVTPLMVGVRTAAADNAPAGRGGGAGGGGRGGRGGAGGGMQGTFPIYNAATGTIAFMQGGVSVWHPTDSVAKSVTRGIDHGMDRALWMPDGKSLLVGSNDSNHVSLYMQPVDGPARRLDLNGVSPTNPYYVDMNVGNDGAIAFTASSPTRPAELYYMANANESPRRMTDINATAAALNLGKTEMLNWTNDTYYENGLLTYPPDFDPSKKYPLVLVIHGGPKGASLLSWGSQAQLLAAKGWLVFQPNYRGSDNLGNTYQRAINNDAGAGPGRDVIAGMEVIKAKGIVDTTRMGVSGWSYGGYMTTWMIGHYNIWKVAVAGAAVTDQLDQQMLGDGANQRGANSPFVSKVAMDRIHEQSPITYVSAMKAPTLIMSNVGDYRVPITQSYKLFHALKDFGVTTQFVAYPISGHNAADPVRTRDVQRRWMGWLDQYLSAPTPVTNVTPTPNK
ncbi:MAG: S9 family peptidase [Gemmatimonadaceae bacterium]